MYNIPQSLTEFTPLGDGGISSQSSDERFIILSPDGNFEEFEKFCKLHGVNFKKVTGRYKNKSEMSYVINARDFDYILDAGHIANQECVLYLTPIAYGYAGYGERNRVAILSYSDGRNKEIGVFRPVNKDQVFNTGKYKKDNPVLNDFTFDGEHYYMVFDHDNNIVNA